jgi:hypothetical protein
MAILNDFIKKSKYKGIQPRKRLDSPSIAKTLIEDETKYKLDLINKMSVSNSIEATDKTSDKTNDKTSDKTSDETSDKTSDEKNTHFHNNKYKSSLNFIKTNDKTSDKTSDIKKMTIKTIPEKRETSDKVVTQPVTKLVTKKHFSELSELSQKILLLMHNSCTKNLTQNTDRLAIFYIKNAVCSTIPSVKRTIHRMISLNILNKIEYKNGRGGWTRYSLDKTICDEILLAKTSDKTSDKLVTQPVTTPSSSSIPLNYINKKSTTINEYGGQKNLFDLDPMWMDINFFGLNDRDKISFGINDLKKIAEKKLLTHEQVQESLEAFGNDFEKDLVKSKGPKRNLFIGTLLKGNQYFSVDPQFKTSEDVFYEDQLKAKIMKHKEKEKLELEVSNIYFSEWIESVSDEDKGIILKDSLNITDVEIKMFNNTTKRNLLKSYYMEKHLPIVLEGLKTKNK